MNLHRSGPQGPLLLFRPDAPWRDKADRTRRAAARIAQFVAALDPTIPYALLAFGAQFEMHDLPTTSRPQAEAARAAAQAAALTRVRIGNLHLLS